MSSMAASLFTAESTQSEAQLHFVSIGHLAQLRLLFVVYGCSTNVNRLTLIPPSKKRQKLPNIAKQMHYQSLLCQRKENTSHKPFRLYRTQYTPWKDFSSRSLPFAHQCISLVSSFVPSFEIYQKRNHPRYGGRVKPFLFAGKYGAKFVVAVKIGLYCLSSSNIVFVWDDILQKHVPVHDCEPFHDYSSFLNRYQWHSFLRQGKTLHRMQITSTASSLSISAFSAISIYLGTISSRYSRTIFSNALQRASATSARSNRSVIAFDASKHMLTILQAPSVSRYLHLLLLHPSIS
nr:MAG TPA: hypothetical protein [Caudoviricetes sp.]